MMIKVSVMYPNSIDAKFDIEYYRDKHMPLVRKLMGDAYIKCSIDHGLVGGEPGSQATYIAMGHIFCESVDAFQMGMGPHQTEIMGDLINFTNIQPIMQISKVIAN